MEISIESLETTSLTKAQLAEILCEKIGLNMRESKDMVDAFFDLICQQLVEGNDVKIPGFGNFQIRDKAARPGRNPRTGETESPTNWTIKAQKLSYDGVINIFDYPYQCGQS